MAYVAPVWLMRLFPDRLRRLIQNPDRLLDGLVGEGMTVADVGCGLGFLTLPLARRVGPNGRVLAVDVQQAMLDVVRHRVDRAGLGQRVETALCRPDDLHLPAGGLDFIVTVCVVHEADDRPRMLRQIRAGLAPGGRYLLAEPMWHVPRAMYEQIRHEASQAGLVELDERPAGFCRAVLLQARDDREET